MFLLTEAHLFLSENKQTGSQVAPCSFLSLQEGFIFISGGAADVADPRQFADVQLPVFVGGIVAEECGGDVLFTHLRPPDLLALGLGVRHP